MKIFVGTKRLTRLNLRRDRITIPATLLLAVGMTAGSAPALVSAYPDYATQLSYVASSVTSAVGRLFQGTIQGVSLGSILMAETFMFTAVILAIMSIFIVSRHTRHNEETGAGELIGSTVVGRSSPLTSALLVAIGANVIAGILMFVVFASIPELDKVGSAYFAAALAMTGIFFAGVSAITVQLSDYRRGANLLAISVLALSFIIRGVGDVMGDINADGLGVTASWVTWLSPLGWANQVLPYYDNNPLPLLLLLVGFIALSAVGYFILSKRDIGSSIFESKPGPARAKASLLRTGGLARRLQRPGLIAWGAGAVLMGAMMGVMVNDFRSTFEENELFQEFFVTSEATASFGEMMISAMFPLIGAMMAGYAVSALAKMQDEEGSGRLEFLVSTTLSRTRWLFTHVKTIIIGVFVTLGLMGLSGAIGYYAATAEPEVGFGDVVLAGLSSVPATLLFIAVVLLIFAVYGRFVKTFAWAFYAYCALIGSFAGIFSWPAWTTNLSPFTHTPAIPASDVDVVPLVIMTALAIVIGAMATILFNRRNLQLK